MNQEHYRSLGQDIAKQMNLPNNHVWIAPMPESNWRVSLPWHKITHPVVQHIETMEEKNSGKLGQCRIYMHPVDDHIPTIIISEHDIVARYAWRDGTPAHPLNGHTCTINMPTGLLSYPEEVKSLPGVAEVLAVCLKPMYSLRKSSFILSHVVDLVINGNEVKAKEYANHFRQHESFWHIMTPDEWTPILPIQNIHGLILTNAPSYVNFHKEIPFMKIK